ncbi:MAG: GNAT family N-acetyltransferase [Oscillatoriales cyanobacterium SM2_2_1]|nr:GNAT family N-acetyltransferase [Oscillatoriales cyanobacterium SM2_2_1]
MSREVEIVLADLTLAAHRDALIQLMQLYTRDPMGGGQELSDYARVNLPHELAKRSSAHVIIALFDGEPVGLAICFDGFSTFACKPLLNIHDLVVDPIHRGQGISKKLLEKAEQIAIELGCCKLTLEVLEGNNTAMAAYRSFGFKSYELDPKMGRALFLEKKLGGVD